MYSPESTVRKTGSYIYEEFMPTDGTDVKVNMYFMPRHYCCGGRVVCSFLMDVVGLHCWT